MFREIKNKRVLTRYYKYEAHEYTVDSFSLRNLSRYREKLINQTRSRDLIKEISAKNFRNEEDVVPLFIVRYIQFDILLMQ